MKRPGQFEMSFSLFLSNAFGLETTKQSVHANQQI